MWIETRGGAEDHNMYFEAFFFTSRVVYTIFQHALDEKRKVPPAQWEGTCTFGRGVMKKILFLPSQLTLVLIIPYFKAYFSHFNTFTWDDIRN